jgi:hypothetical protein
MDSTMLAGLAIRYRMLIGMLIIKIIVMQYQLRGNTIIEKRT